MIKLISIFLNIKHKYRISRLKLNSKGSNVLISPGFSFSETNNITIGDNVYIGPYSTINGIGGVTIGSGTIIGPKLTIYTANHRYKDGNAIPYDDVLLPGKVEIGENIWIGGNVIIVPRVQIGEGCIVAAGSVVTKSFPPFKVIGGNPAKVIKDRDKNHYLQLKQQMKIYLLLKSQRQMIPHIETYAE